MHADPDDHPAHEPPAWRGTARRVFAWALVGLAALGVGLAAYIAALYGAAPGGAQLKDVQSARPSTLLTADRQPLGSFRREKQARVPLAEISPNVVNALIATEDHRFREHPGVDVLRTISAVFHTATGDLQGGSTLTQQLARNLFPEDLDRKSTR